MMRSITGSAESDPAGRRAAARAARSHGVAAWAVTARPGGARAGSRAATVPGPVTVTGPRGRHSANCLTGSGRRWARAMCVYEYVSVPEIQTSYRLNANTNYTILFIGQSHTYAFKQIHAHSDCSYFIHTCMYLMQTCLYDVCMCMYLFAHTTYKMSQLLCCLRVPKSTYRYKHAGFLMIISTCGAVVMFKFDCSSCPLRNLFFLAQFSEMQFGAHVYQRVLPHAISAVKLMKGTSVVFKGGCDSILLRADIMSKW
jgi:hypothetical protein